MTQEITQDAIRSLSAPQLDSVDAWIREERKARADRHRQETLAKIKALAKSIDIGVKIEGRGGGQKEISSLLKTASVRELNSLIARYTLTSYCF